jgi:hypothetical protein
VKAGREALEALPESVHGLPPFAAICSSSLARLTYLTWTGDNLLRHTVYVGLREDKPAEQVRLES